MKTFLHNLTHTTSGDGEDRRVVATLVGDAVLGEKGQEALHRHAGSFASGGSDCRLIAPAPERGQPLAARRQGGAARHDPLDTPS